MNKFESINIPSFSNGRYGRHSKLLADKLIGVQPLTTPASLTFYMRYRYSNTSPFFQTEHEYPLAFKFESSHDLPLLGCHGRLRFPHPNMSLKYVHISEDDLSDPDSVALLVTDIRDDKTGSCLWDGELVRFVHMSTSTEFNERGRRRKYELVVAAGLDVPDDLPKFVREYAFGPDDRCGAER